MRFEDRHHPNVSLSDWQSFSAWQKSIEKLPASLISEVIDRNETQLPDWFVPLARGVAVAHYTLLGAPFGFVSSLPVSSCWRPAGDNIFKWDVAGVCGWYVQGFGNLWIAGRWSLREGERVLVHQFGATPIVTRHCRSAMRLSLECRAFGSKRFPTELRYISVPQIVTRRLSSLGSAEWMKPVAQTVSNWKVICSRAKTARQEVARH
jgi:hypothetical protein